MNLSSKLANNSKLTNNEYKWLENNLYLYYNVRDYKFDFCPKKQTIVML